MKIYLKKSQVKDSYSDGIDIDFSIGEIDNIKIFNSINYGLDISGSTIKSNNISISNSNDKGLSIGEASSIQLDKLFIKDTFVAIANKDGSIAKINNVDIYDSKYDFVGFNKKNEYSGSSSKINFLKTNNNKFNYLLANPSALIMNNLIYEANSENKTISNLIYK